MDISFRHNISEHKLDSRKIKGDREGKRFKNTLESLTGEATNFLFLSS